ncbi:hypothetical protein V428_10155 [Aeromonas hydrophila subsp. hydrophila AL09-71]|nr:hypothetical protein AHML_09895 [Aeromonas hydrophila ML09-119]AHX32444.1 hypothetical protein V428_10155 [Aeromonas hydrophila subsp. hydrophila AL09-71]AHX69242.1 hypothetical protein V429_10160 [Aeromonas hydrophila pc104A]
MALFQQSLALKSAGTAPAAAGRLFATQCLQQDAALLGQQAYCQSGCDQCQKIVVIFYFQTDIGQGDQIPAQMNARLVYSLNISPFQDPTAVFMVILQTIVTERETEVRLNQLQ